jgi:hypothetical protein
MTTYRVSELEGVMLDLAVAKATGIEKSFKRGYRPHQDRLVTHEDSGGQFFYSPSTNWHQGGPLIDEYRIFVAPMPNRDSPLSQVIQTGGWAARKLPCFEGEKAATGSGQTPLIAAMRALVAAKFGEVVDL